MMLVMYSVSDRRSFELSASFLAMAMFTYRKFNSELRVCLIANKSDLVRAREVGTEEGRLLADKFEVHFVELSIELEDNFEQIVDWITNSIKNRLHIKSASSASTTNFCSSNSNKKNSNLSQKAISFIRRILNKNGSKSRSCDNIHLM